MGWYTRIHRHRHRERDTHTHTHTHTETHTHMLEQYIYLKTASTYNESEVGIDLT